jgi:hypothetical protein
MTSASKATKGADADTELVQRQFTEPPVEDLERPAFGADHEAAGQQSAETQQTPPARNQRPCALPGGTARPTPPHQPQHAQEQPDAVVNQDLHQTAGGFGPAQDLRQHGVPGRVLDGVPGQQR